MKIIFILLILSFSIQMSFGQACGTYRIKYIGKIKSSSLKIEKIKIPTILMLHRSENDISKRTFIEFEPNNSEINIELQSHLTSSLYNNSENLFHYYSTKRKRIPIIFVVVENGKQKEIEIEIDWKNVIISKIEDNGFGNLFEIKLNEIHF